MSSRIHPEPVGAEVSRTEIQALESQRLERERDLDEKLARVRERLSAIEGAQKAGRIWLGVVVSLFGIVVAAGVAIIVAILGSTPP